MLRQHQVMAEHLQAGRTLAPEAAVAIEPRRACCAVAVLPIRTKSDLALFSGLMPAKWH